MPFHPLVLSPGVYKRFVWTKLQASSLYPCGQHRVGFQVCSRFSISNPGSYWPNQHSCSIRSSPMYILFTRSFIFLCVLSPELLRTLPTSSSYIADFIMQSWRPGTKKQYETYLRQWLEFCNQRQITYHSPSMSDALGFLLAIHNKGLSYSTIGTARSALSNVIVSGECENFGTHSLVSRFMKSVFLQNKPLPKYDCTWDVAVVLKYLETLYPHSDITLKNLTLKLVMIILLVSGQRGQTVHLMDLSSMEMADNTCRFHITEHIKTSKPGASAPIILIKQYPQNAKICPLRTLRDYLSRTNLLRGGASQLFITPPARRAWRSFKFAPFLFFFRCRKSSHRSWVIPLAFLCCLAHCHTSFKPIL